MVTTELRYFFRNGLSDVWQAFIKKQSRWRLEEIQDHYLLPDISTSCGVKYRQGNLEVKSLVKSLMFENCPIQVWEKITVGPQSKPDLDEGWREIRKKRWLFYYDQNLSKTLQPTSGELNCQVEISEIELNGHLFHSFCLECSDGQKEQLSDFLLRCLNHLKDIYPTISAVLNAQQACSYPAFLIGHTAST